MAARYQTTECGASPTWQVFFSWTTVSRWTKHVGERQGAINAAIGAQTVRQFDLDMGDGGDQPSRSTSHKRLGACGQCGARAANGVCVSGRCCTCRVS